MATLPEALRVRAERIGLFETPVLHGRVDDAAVLNDALRTAITAKRAESASAGRSNVGGWHSPTDMLAWGGPAAATLAETAIRLAKRASHFEDRDPAVLIWSVRMWANLSPPGALNMSHAHPGALWAAVYYLDMGNPGPDGGGELYFEDPRFPVPQMTFPGFRALGIDGAPQVVEHRVATQPGDLILFPGFLRHGVRPHSGSAERLSVAMNIYVRDPAGAA
jgi:uncharacterized protein (TIGR02466 family)